MNWEMVCGILCVAALAGLLIAFVSFGVDDDPEHYR